MPLNSSDITIIVPTFNRADFLARLLAYYAQVQFQGHILIGDASDHEQAALVRKTAEEYQDGLKVHYHHLPGISIAQTVFLLNSFIQTPFVALIGDDDFLVVKGLCQCVDFLNNHPDYIAANGCGGLLLVEDGMAYGKIKDLGDYPLKGVDAEDPGQRLEDFLRNYCVALFSLFRVESWRQMWIDTSHVQDVAFAAELLPNCTAAIIGKIKHLDVLYLIRQGHQRRYLLSKGYDWVTSEAWQGGYLFFHRRVMALLMSQGSREADAVKRIKDGFGAYLNKCLTGRLCKTEQIKSFIEKIPMGGMGLAKILRDVCARRLSRCRKISMDKLLSPLNTQHNDFKLIYQLITNHH